MPQSALAAFPYAEAPTAVPNKRLTSTASSTPPLWGASIVDSITVSTGEKLFMVGGFDVRSGRVVTHTRAWDASTHLWSRLPDAPVQVALASAAAVPLDGSVVLFGGWDGEQCSGELWHLHCRGGTAAGGEVNARPGKGGSSQRTPSGAASGASGTASGARARTTKGSEEVSYKWTRIEVDARGSARPSGRYGHALVCGLIASPSLASPSRLSSALAEVPSPREKAPRLTSAVATRSSTPDPLYATTDMEAVLFVFGGSDMRSLLNDLWRLPLRSSLDEGVAHWERLEVKRGVCPCPRENAIMAFDTARQCLWLYGGRSETDDLHDLWCLPLHSDASGKLTWVPIQPSGGFSYAPTFSSSIVGCRPMAAVVANDCLYLSFSDTPTSAKRLEGMHVPLFCFSLHHNKWQPALVSEVRRSVSYRASIRGSSRTSQPKGYHFTATCACGNFISWLREAVDVDALVVPSTPTLMQMELNMSDPKPSKRRAERSR